MACFSPLNPLYPVRHISLAASEDVPIALVFLQRRYAQELVNGRLRFVALQLLRIVVFVFDINIAALLLVVVFVLEVVSVPGQARPRDGVLCTYSSSESCMKSSSSDILASKRLSYFVCRWWFAHHVQDVSVWLDSWWSF